MQNSISAWLFPVLPVFPVVHLAADVRSSKEPSLRRRVLLFLRLDGVVVKCAASALKLSADPSASLVDVFAVGCEDLAVFAQVLELFHHVIDLRKQNL